MKKIILATILALGLTSNINAASKGQELYEQKCATCHTRTPPADTSTMVAPPIQGVMYHMSELFNKAEMQEHINDFVRDPSKEEAICKSVRRFGLMPSQKDNITKEELEMVAQYMMDEFYTSKDEYENGKKNKKNHNH